MIHTESEKRCKYICVMLCACDYSEKAISPITWWGPHYIHCTVPLASSSLRPSANTIFPPRPSAITELRGHSLAEWRNLPVVRPRRRERGSQFSSPFRPVIWNVYRIISTIFQQSITWWGPHYIHCTVPLASSSPGPSANVIFPPRPSAIAVLRGHSLAAEWSRNLPLARPSRRVKISVPLPSYHLEWAQGSKVQCTLF